MKYFSTELDTVFDTVEELEKAEKEYKSILNYGDDLEKLENEDKELDHWFQDEYAKLQSEFQKRSQEISKKRDEIVTILHKYEAGEDTPIASVKKESKKAVEKKAEKKDKKDDSFFFEYKSTENGKEKEHLVAHSLNEFQEKIKKFIG